MNSPTKRNPERNLKNRDAPLIPSSDGERERFFRSTTAVSRAARREAAMIKPNRYTAFAEE